MDDLHKQKMTVGEASKRKKDQIMARKTIQKLLQAEQLLAIQFAA